MPDGQTDSQRYNSGPVTRTLPRTSLGREDGFVSETHGGHHELPELSAQRRPDRVAEAFLGCGPLLHLQAVVDDGGDVMSGQYSNTAVGVPRTCPEHRSHGHSRALR